LKSDLEKLTGDLMPDIIDFARQLVRTPSVTGQEGDLAARVAAKMRELDYDSVSVDPLGNVIGVIGEGLTNILYDSHMDTVTVNNPGAWQYDPFGGEVVDGRLYGRGSTDMKGALSAAVFAGHMAKRLGMHKNKRLTVSASVMEEDYDGEAVYSMCRQMESIPDYVIVCEPSDLKLALGHKGRALIRVTTDGVPAHGSAPEKGVNAIYKMGPIIKRVEELNHAMMQREGETGTIALTRIDSSAESLNAIPSRCDVYLDRRLVLGENQSCIAAEMESLLEGIEAQWEIYDKHGTSYTGKKVVLHSFLPSWEIQPDSVLSQACIRSFKAIFNRDPELVKWDFCTNGVATAGRLNIPTIGFGPGDSKKAHTVDEYCEISQIKAAAQFYATLPAWL
jgi:putative selenium metabolism hydrolase